MMLELGIIEKVDTKIVADEGILRIKGSCLISQLFNLFIKFCLYPITNTADIE